MDSEGCSGTVEPRHDGPFRNPESLAHGGDGLPPQYLYQVRFAQKDVWGGYQGPVADTVLVDIFEHWLEEAAP